MPFRNRALLVLITAMKCNLEISDMSGKEKKRKKQSEWKKLWIRQYKTQGCKWGNGGDNDSHCFALPQALLNSKQEVKGSQEPEHFVC